MDQKAWDLLMITVNDIKDDIKETNKELKKCNKSINGLKLKVAGFASIFGYLAAYIKSKTGL